MSEVDERLDAVLAGEEGSSDDDPSKCEHIEALIPSIGWDGVLASVLAVLRDDTRAEDDWRVAAEILWGAALDARPMDGDIVIAHLCARFPVCREGEDNLAWSITTKLKKVEYLSDYDPMTDPGVRAELARLHDRRGRGD